MARISNNKERAAHQLTREERYEMMRKYNEGTQLEKEEATQQLIECLDSYIYYMIHKNFAGYIGIIEDLAQSGRLAVIEHAKDYNPEFKMTTFFSFHIQNALQDVVNGENGESHYYAESKNIIVKTIRELGMSPDNIDEQTLAMHLNMTTGRLHSILEKTLNKKKIELIEQDGETAVSEFGSPEKNVMEAERTKEFRECIEQLDKTEQIVICMHYGFVYPVWNPYGEVFKLADIQKKFDDADMDVNIINVYRSARRHITDIMYDVGIINKRNRYINAKDEVGLKFKDTESAHALFDALNDDVLDEELF